jgi:serine/threonine protein kinase
MEYVSGGDLLSLIKREPLTPEKSARFLNQIASALEAIHAAGIVHRDLKPENILITTDEQVKLADFGVARLRGSQTLTQAGAMVGTPKYIPPEYLETGESDHRGDIFALGVLGYEMLSGVSPFPDDSRELLATRRHTLKPPPLVKVAPHCPPELALIIERAMSPNLAQRYQSATDLRRDIERFLGDETVRDEGAAIRGTDMTSFSAAPLRESKSRLSPTRIVGGGAVVGLFTALIVVIAYPRSFGAVLPAEEPQQFDFAVISSESKEPIVIDPRELGLELVRIGDLERLYGEIIDGGTGASLGTTSAPIKERGPQIEGEPGAVSFLKVRERRLWLEREIASLKGSGSTLSGD